MFKKNELKKNEVIFQAYSVLNETGFVNSESEFAQDWLGKGECYMRTLRFKNAEPSLGSLAICACRLLKTGRQLSKVRKFRALGSELVRLSDLLNDQVSEISYQIEHT